MSPPPFVGNELTSLLKVKELDAFNRGMGWVVSKMEGAQGLSYLKFLQDSMVALVPKLLVSRSVAEATETSFLELLESFVIYFSMPLMAGKVMKGFFHSLMPKMDGKALNPELLTRPLSELTHGPNALKAPALSRVLSAKAAIILSTLGLTVAGGEYVVNYAKNLMTARLFKKDSFSDVVNLSKGTMASNQPSPVADKAKKRIAQCLMLCAGIFGTSLVLGRYGSQLGRLQIGKLHLGSKMQNGFDQALKKLVGLFDFQYSLKGEYGLSHPQLLAYMGLAIPAYIDASRDKLEKVEVISRLGLVMTYLAVGQEALQKLLGWWVGKTAPSGPVQVFDEQKHVKPLATLAQESIALAKTELPGKSQAEILTKAAEHIRKPLFAKNILFGVPLAVGVLGAGLGVGMLNRFWTAYRFRRAAIDAASLPTPALPLAPSPQPGLPVGGFSFPVAATPLPSTSSFSPLVAASGRYPTSPHLGLSSPSSVPQTPAPLASYGAYGMSSPASTSTSTMNTGYTGAYASARGVAANPAPSYSQASSPQTSGSYWPATSAQRAVQVAPFPRSGVVATSTAFAPTTFVPAMPTGLPFPRYTPASPIAATAMSFLK